MLGSVEPTRSARGVWLALGSWLLLGACVESTAPTDELVSPGGKTDDVVAGCAGFCGERNFAAQCSCQDDCSALQDCCPDIAQTCEDLGLVERVHEGPGVLDCPGTRLDQHGYLTCHDDNWLIPRWILYYTDRPALQANVERTDDFRADPRLPSGGRAELRDYFGSGFHRGHMAPAADFRLNEDVASATFVLSNVAPQHPDVNLGVWKTLEAQVRDAVLDRYGVGWVYTGNLIVDGDGDGAEPRRIGDSGVAVPTHCYKVLLNQESDGSYRAYGFIVPNIPDLDGTPKQFQFPVEQIELAAEIDLFSELPDDIEQELERTVFPWPATRE